MNLVRLDRLDRDTLRHHIRTGMPALLPGFTRSWPAHGKWTPEYLAAACDGRPIRVSHYPDGKHCAGTVPMTVRDYLDRIVRAGGSERYYMETNRLRELSPELYADLRFPDYLDELPDCADFVFFGKDTGSRCHIHPHAEAVVLQLLGRKTFHLFHPSDVDNLYFRPIYQEFFTSRVDFSNLDLQKFPLARKVRPIPVVLEAGDALYLPVHWPHWTLGDGVNFTLTRFSTASVRQYRFPFPGLNCLADRLVRGVQSY